VLHEFKVLPHEPLIGMGRSQLTLAPPNCPRQLHLCKVLLSVVSKKFPDKHEFKSLEQEALIALGVEQLTGPPPFFPRQVHL
jgi:hypothetical protein